MYFSSHSKLLNVRGMRKYKPLTSREFGAGSIGKEEGWRVVNHDAFHFKSGHVLNHSESSGPQDSNARRTGLGRLIRKQILLLSI